MAIQKCTYTHYGWMGLCPVYIYQPEGPDTVIDARHPWLEWLHDLSIAIFDVMNFVGSVMNPEYDEGYPLWVAGELDKPISREFDDGE